MFHLEHWSESVSHLLVIWLLHWKYELHVGKNLSVLFRLYLQGLVQCLVLVCVLSCFNRVWLCDPLDCSPPGSSVHGDSPGKNTGVGCLALLQESSQPKDRTHVSCVTGGVFTHWATWEACLVFSSCLNKCLLNDWIHACMLGSVDSPWWGGRDRKYLP